MDHLQHAAVRITSSSLPEESIIPLVALDKPADLQQLRDLTAQHGGIVLVDGGTGEVMRVRDIEALVLAEVRAIVDTLRGEAIEKRNDPGVLPQDYLGGVAAGCNLIKERLDERFGTEE